VVGVVASTVLACRATLKLEDTLDEIKKDFDNLAEFKNLGPNPDPSDIPEGERRLKFRFSTGDQDPELQDYYKIDQDAAWLMGQSALKVVKLYAPAVIVGTVSIAALTGSHVQMTRRNAALMAAYSTLQEAYNAYRERVREQLGEERELELHRGIKTEIVKDEHGKREIKSVDPNKMSPYARCFDETSTQFKKDAELNKFFIQSLQTYYNHRLRARGHVFLNEVYDDLGFERTKEGQCVGWVMDGDGDNFIDFGIYEAYNSRFINALERSVWLDFNVDGVILDYI
jgi:hypothetical protein